MDSESRFWTGRKKQTLYFLIGSALLSIGTPAIVAATRPGAEFYLLQPFVFVGQAIPNIVAAALWLPGRSARASKIGLILAGLLFAASVLFYVSILTDILPTGGDMIALGYLLFAFVTLVSILAATGIAYTVSWMLERRAKRSDAPTSAL
jgi:hypothetical protein